jgi:enoyl-CoA hydratase/carnithine racemase
MTARSRSVDLEIRDGVARIAINNPDKRNCFDDAMFDLLFDATQAIAADGSVCVAVIRGVGDKAFSAGADIDSVIAGDDYLATFLDAETHMNRATEALAALEVPVIAGLRGACMGGGVQVAVAADFRLAADDLQFAIPAAALGVMYPLPPIETLVRQAGPAAVKKLLIEGKPVDARTALALGFVEEVTPVAEFDTRLAELVETVRAQPPEIVRAYKRIVDNIAAGRPHDNAAVREVALNSGVLPRRLAKVAEARRRKRALRAR